jgi:hypothetical protein
MNEDKKYMIFNVSDLLQINFDEVLETSISTVRKSVDESKTFVKWYGDEIPISVSNLITKEGPYTHDEMLVILSSSFWTPYQI